MNFEMIKKDTIIAGVRNKKEILFSLASFIIFFAVASYYLLSIRVSEEDVPNYAVISRNSFEKYESMMKASGIKALSGDRKFKLYKYNYKLDEYIARSVPGDRRENPFKKEY